MPKRAAERQSRRQVKRQRQYAETEQKFEGPETVYTTPQSQAYRSRRVSYDEDEITPAPNATFRHRTRSRSQAAEANGQSKREEIEEKEMLLEAEDDKEDDMQPEEMHSQEEMEEVEVDDEEQEDEEDMEDVSESADPSSEVPALRKSSGFATCGILNSIEMYRFMCHSRFKISFGPNVNIINGENGSGKSAIVAALQVGLAGSARDTERGTKIQDLIQHTKNDALVLINIWNRKGDDKDLDMSYKHEEYGDIITIERRLRRNGANSWSVRGRLSKPVPLGEGVKPYQEVQNIVDHFGFMVKNPVSILTQTKSKTFLAGQKPTKHYQFYQEATLLAPLETELKLTIGVTEEIRTILKRTEDALPETDRKLAKLEANYRNSQAMKNIDKTIRDAEILSAWVIVHEADEKRLEYERKTHDEIAPRAEQLSSELAKIGKKLDSLVSERDSRHQKVDEASSKVQMFNKTCQEIRRNVLKADAELKNFRRRLVDVDSEADDVEKRVKDANLRMEQARKEHFAGQEQKSRLLEEFRKLGLEEKELQERIQTMASEEAAFLEEKYYKEEAVQKAKQEFSRCRTEFEDKRRQHIHETAMAKNRTGVARFGDDVVQVTRGINQRRSRFRHPPIGPLAQYVKLRDQSWDRAIEVAMGRNLLMTYIVHDVQDAALLKSTFPGRFRPNVLISDLTRKRYRVGDNDVPALQDSRYRTILETMDIEHDAVFNALLDMAQIEKVVLSTEDDVRNLAWKRVRNVHTVWNKRADRAYIRNGSNTFRHAPHGVCARYLTKDMGPYLAALARDASQANEDVRRSEDMLAHRSDELRGLLNKLEATVKDLSSSRAKLTNMQRRKNTIEDQLNHAENAFNPEPFEREIADLESTMKNLDHRRGKVQQEASHFEQSKASLQEEHRKVSAESEEFRNEAAHLTESLESINKEVARVKSRHRTLKTDSEKASERLKMARREVNVQQNKVVEYTEAARSLGSSPKNVDWSKESSEKAQRRVRTLQERLRTEQKRRGGKSAHEIETEYLQAVKQYKDNQEKRARIAHYENCLLVGIKRRREKLFKLNRVLKTLVRNHFRQFLGAKGHTGNLRFRTNSSGETELRITTQLQHHDMKDGERHTIEQLSSMSGGERSYTTLAFILALAEVCQMPVRVFDEIDVFQDDATRRVAFRKMTDFCTQYLSDRQIIIITPQKLPHLESSPSIRIQVLEPPRPATDSSGRRQSTIDEFTGNA
ncbi:Structural maintenance of chromosomes protein [Gracilaria domingensis]|nr:Structural maintenance of chromosomes protein [Gracilaria domingensis]